MMLLDNTYIRIGEIDPKSIFKFEDITHHVLAKQAETEAVSGQLGYALERKEEPKISIGARCLLRLNVIIGLTVGLMYPIILSMMFFKSPKHKRLRNSMAYL
jgi:hypothetical protein